MSRPQLERFKTPTLPDKPIAIILVADGTEEIEFATAYDILVRAGVNVRSVGVGLEGINQHVTLSRGMKVIPDNQKWDLSIGIPSLIVVPGGAEGAKKMTESATVQKQIRVALLNGGWVAAICAGTTAIVAAVEECKSEEEKKELRKWRVTSHPSVKEEIVGKGWEYSEERVCVDGKVITSRGPGTAMGWALTLVEHLVSKEKRKELEEPLMLADPLRV